MTSRLLSTFSIASLLLTCTLKAYDAFTLRLALRNFEFLPSKTYTYKGPDYPSELPGAYADVALVFSANDTIKYPLADDNAWKSLLPDEVGMVRLGLKGRPFGVSMYHQLHCITHMRSSYVRARSGAISPQQVDMAVAHDIHCLQFLRHSILCHGDTTLISIESNSTSEELHRCRDWTAVRAYVEKNKSEWEGIPYSDALEDLL